MRRCKNCGQMLGDDEKYCPSCGSFIENEPEPEPVQEEQKAEFSYETKICKKCGAEIHTDAVICPKCGCMVEENVQNNESNTPAVQGESSTLATCALIFGILGGWIGLILSIIGLATLKEEKNRKKCKIGLGFVIGWAIIFIIIAIL